MRTIDVVVVGGGQSGLAMSRSLASHGIDHVVLERGRIGERWHSESWKSLRLLTPASHSALLGLAHAGVDPEHFLSAAELAAYLGRYAGHVSAPVVTSCAVRAVEHAGIGFTVTTDVDAWHCKAIVIATGACDVPLRPPPAARLDASIEQVVPRDYKSADQLPAGGVLVVGASSSGLQLAEEIHASGRPVTLAVGSHTRLPRRYRGMDIFAAMEVAGILDDRAEACEDIEAARRQPSTQLVGRDDRRDIDLGILEAQGVRLVGRLTDAEGTRVQFDDSLADTTAASHSRMARTLLRIDAAFDSRCGPAPGQLPEAIPPLIMRSESVQIDLKRASIRSVVWATGYVRRYPWLKLPLLDGHGEIRHRGGITCTQGIYVMGQRFLRRRRSHFIDGCGLDADELAPTIRSHLDGIARQAA